jgi:uncharacterized radical SAM protein YgiQ
MTRNKTTSEAQGFLPMTRAEMDRLGWDALDILIVTGDAYVDHPSFGAALLGRWLLAHGYRVGIVAQPRWDTIADVARMGRPRLFAGVTAGALDSMLAHYTAFRKKRRDDAYTPGGKAGARPNRASIVYTSLVRKAFPGLPVVLGGIEASLRRAAHYDFWTDRVRRSILLESQADLIAYGMGERVVLEIAERLKKAAPGDKPRDVLRAIPGTVYVVGGTRPVVRPPCGPAPNAIPEGATVVQLPSIEEMEAEPFKLMEATLAIERQVHEGRAFATQSAAGHVIVIAPPAKPLTTEELDRLYALPFTRLPHPSYKEAIPAVEMIEFSVTSHRGCGGGCSFCSLALHQGRRIASRSAKSILAEVRALTRHPRWKGSISDIGGPSANMWGAACGTGAPACAPSSQPRAAGPHDCTRASCLYPDICPNFKESQGAIAELLREVAKRPGVKSVRVASGVRHDLALRSEDYVRALVGEFVGGQLKLAPEHRVDAVLKLMRKPAFRRFEEFLTLFERVSRDAGKEQYVIPYLISAFPGCTDDDMRVLAGWLKEKGWRPQQVQCFIPTPGTVATAMYYSARDPEGNPIPVARTDAERMRQHYLIAPGKFV